MPSWKKVITSGSAAELSSLYAPSITGSLLGTSSYANNANSASYATTSSYVTASGVYGPYGSNSVTSASYAVNSTVSERTTQVDVLVLNQTGFDIPKGTVVRITGSNNASDIPRISTASYENDNNSANTLGITTQAINNGSQGFVITEGILIGIDTSNYISGQLLYLGATGSITGSAPLAPLHTVRLGEVIRQQSNNGSIYVSINNGYELGELHDVLDTTTTSSHGDLLVKSGSIWINSKQLTGSYGLTGSLIITGSTSGDLLRITQTGTGNSFVVEDSTNPDSTPFVIDTTGRTGIGTSSPNALLTISSSAANGINLGADTSSLQQSARLFFSNSTPGQGISLRNFSGSLFFATSASVGVTSGNTVMTISGSNIGIGTTNPSQGTLQVVGNVFATSFTGSLQGTVTSPNRPAFRVIGTSSTNIAAVTTISGSASSIDYNQGNYYNNTTGVFTAPIAGLYSIYMNLRVSSDNATKQAILYKNDTTSSLMWESSTNTGAQHFGVSSIINLGINDTLKVVVTVGTIQFDSNDSWGATYIG